MHHILVIYEGDFRGRLLHAHRTRERASRVAEIARPLVAVTRGLR